jgi:hypothetical protein
MLEDRKMVAPSADLRSLIVSPDTETVATLVQVFRDSLAVAAESCSDGNAAAQCFVTAKFEALVVDFDRIVETLPFLQNLRQSRANRNAVVLAIATDASAKRRAAAHGAAFLLQRPIVAAQVARVMRAAYGLMLRDRRQYFRLEVELSVSLRTDSGVVLHCKTMNVSREGMALRTSSPLRTGDSVGVVFQIPTPGPVIIAEGSVIWDDKHGKAGLHLSFGSSEDKDRISEWLDSEFHMQVGVSKGHPD